MFTRKDKPGTCPSCHKGGYNVQPSRGDARPLFTCGHCGWTWTCGHDGGEYLSDYGRAKFRAHRPDHMSCG